MSKSLNPSFQLALLSTRLEYQFVNLSTEERTIMTNAYQSLSSAELAIKEYFKTTDGIGAKSLDTIRVECLALPACVAYIGGTNLWLPAGEARRVAIYFLTKKVSYGIKSYIDNSQSLGRLHPVADKDEWKLAKADANGLTD